MARPVPLEEETPMILKQTLAAVALALLSLQPALADGERATKEQAQAMVKKAVAFIKANGADKAYTEFDKRDGQFVDRDLYVVTYDLTGKCLAHGGNIKFVGKDLIDTEDADGKAFVKERVELAKTKESFWQDYKFADPTTKKIEPKETYCERLNDTVVCAGVYKP